VRTLHRIEQFLDRHGHKVERAVDHTARAADRRSRGRHRGPIDRGAEAVKRAVRGTGSRDRPGRRTW
jgi:hypothetical protein